MIGLWFTLRTHVRQIYHTPPSPSSLNHDNVTESLNSQHDSPNWSKTKSMLILLICTVFFAWIAGSFFFIQEVLVQSVDVVTEGMNMDEKLLGLTLFAIVPNVTEFMNAIAFALYGNIALRSSSTSF